VCKRPSRDNPECLFFIAFPASFCPQPFPILLFFFSGAFHAYEDSSYPSQPSQFNSIISSPPLGDDALQCLRSYELGFYCGILFSIGCFICRTTEVFKSPSLCSQAQVLWFIGSGRLIMTKGDAFSFLDRSLFNSSFAVAFEILAFG